MLRFAFLPRRSRRRFVAGASSLAGAARRDAVRRPDPSASCSAQMTAERSDRAPKISALQSRDRQPQASFSPSKASTISTSAAGSLGRVFRAKRHVEKLHENALNRQQNKATQPTFVGRFVTFGTTRDHSESPSISIASCAPVTRIVPSRTGGQAKPPSSSHFVASTMPEPSKTRIFKRSDASSGTRKHRRYRDAPANPSATSATKPCTPFRKSIGCVATNTRASRPNDITASTSPPPTRAPESQRRRRPAPAPSRRQSSPRSVQSDPQKREAGRSHPAALRLRRRAWSCTNFGCGPSLDARRALRRQTLSNPRLTPLRRATSEMFTSGSALSAKSAPSPHRSSRAAAGDP